MANRWIYRFPEIYWQAQRPHKDVISLGTIPIDLTPPLDTPRQLDKMRQQAWARSARRYPPRVIYIQHLEMRDFYIASPQTFTVFIAGGMT